MTHDPNHAPERIAAEQMDDFDELLEMELNDDGDDLFSRALDALDPAPSDGRAFTRRTYLRELIRLQAELVKLQDWVVREKLKVVVLFEGRDAAGKGGVIKRITQRLNPRVCRVVALTAPTERERTQWYFQRYVSHLPGAGEIVLFDRSWYNRAGVERVMGFCSADAVEEFFQTVPEFERMLVRSGCVLIKYWFSITDEEQHLRFHMRNTDPLKQWKLSPMDLESRRRWEQYTVAKEEMLARTHIPEARWWVVDAVDKQKARLNCIRHLLDQFPYEEIVHPPVPLPPREHSDDYVRHPVPPELFVPSVLRDRDRHVFPVSIGCQVRAVDRPQGTLHGLGSARLIAAPRAQGHPSIALAVGADPLAGGFKAAVERLGTRPVLNVQVRIGDAF